MLVLVFDNPLVWNGIMSDPTPNVPGVPDYVSKDEDENEDDDEYDIRKRSWRRNKKSPAKITGLSFFRLKYRMRPIGWMFRLHRLYDA